MTLALDPVSIAIGSAVRPTVALTATNDSGGVVELGDVRTVDVVDAEGRAVTVFVGFQRLDYRPNPVGPAGPLTLDLDIPLSSCDLAIGYAIPPGEYTMVAATQVGTATAPLTVTP